MKPYETLNGQSAGWTRIIRNVKIQDHRALKRDNTENYRIILFFLFPFSITWMLSRFCQQSRRNDRIDCFHRGYFESKAPFQSGSRSIAERQRPQAEVASSLFDRVYFTSLPAFQQLRRFSSSKTFNLTFQLEKQLSTEYFCGGSNCSSFNVVSGVTNRVPAKCYEIFLILIFLINKT